MKRSILFFCLVNFFVVFANAQSQQANVWPSESLVNGTKIEQGSGEIESEIIPSNISLMKDTPNISSDSNIESGEEFFYEGLWYTILDRDNHTCETRAGVGYEPGNNGASNLIIPSKVVYDSTDYTVIGIGDYGFCKESIINADLPQTLKEIGSYAFYGCRSLESVSLPNSVTRIGKYAFWGCYTLSSIDFPQELTLIEEHSFDCCTSLSHLEFPNSLISIGYNAFYGCTGVVSIKFPPSLTTIGMWAFERCTRLVSIDLPEGVCSIRFMAFAYCESLLSVTLPKSIDEIDMHAFEYCDKLMSIKYMAEKPINSETSIFDASTYEKATLTCPNALLRNIRNKEPWMQFQHIEAKDYSYPIDAYEGMEFQYDQIWYEVVNADSKFVITRHGENGVPGSEVSGDIVIPAIVQYNGIDFRVIGLGNMSFINCKDLTSISIANVMKIYGDRAFEGCTSLISVELSSSITDIPYRTFQNCSSLTSVELPSGLTSIGDYAFYRCGSLIAVVLPSGLTSIGEAVFGYCSSLTSVELPSGLTSIGYAAFLNCSSLTSVELPSGLTFLGSYAFQNCGSLTSVELPSGLTKIEYGAFMGCSSLTSVELPSGLTSIGSSAFCLCSSLVSVELPLGLTRIEADTFKYCYSIRNIHYAADKLSEGSMGCFEADVYRLALLSVPNALMEDVQHTNPWREFKHIFAKDDCIPREFECDNNRYEVLDFANRTCSIIGTLSTTENEVFREISLPEDVRYFNFDFTVTDIGDYSFRGDDSLSSITIPETVTEIGIGVFSECKNLAIIVYEGTSKLPGDIMNVNDNPNRLLYVNSQASAPAGLTGNVVVMNGTSGSETQSFLITQGYPLMVGKDFTAATAGLTKEFRQKTPVGGNAGWETIVLPFDVASITYEGREMKPLSSTGSVPQNPFWLYEADANGRWKEASRIRAGIPYIIAMPNSPDYDPVYNVDGEVTFTANAVRISRTTAAPYAVHWADGREFRSLWMPLSGEEAQNAMGLNAGISGLTDSAGNVLEPGSAFCLDVTPKPLEAYVTRGSSAERVMRIGGAGDGQSLVSLPTLSGDLTMISDGDGLRLCSLRDRTVEVYRPDGVRVATVHLRAGEPQRVPNLAKGIYIVAGRKLTVN